MRQINPKENNGSIILAFSYMGTRWTYTPVPNGKFSNQHDLAKARGIAAFIYDDCVNGCFDPTFQKYKRNKQEGTLKDKNNELSNEVNLLELFNDFTNFKSQRLRVNSLIDYDRIQNKLEKCPYKLVSKSKQIIEWLVNDCNGVNKSSVVKQWKLINACCKWGLREKRIKSNPFDNLKADIPVRNGKRGREDIDPFSDEEMRQIIDAFSNHPSYSQYVRLVKFMFATGCRPNEALGLQWKHINSNRITFCQIINNKGEVEPELKTTSKRTITVSEQLLNSLIEGMSIKPADFVFKSKTDSCLDWGNFVNRPWRKILESLPHIRYRNPYQMRHTNITIRANRGEDTCVIARQVGSSPKMIVDHYLGDVSKNEIKDLFS